MKKLGYLDGMRGLMSMNVIINHFVCVYYPAMYSLSWAQKYGGATGLEKFSGTPLNALVNGNIAVQYFFVLSGFLAAIGVFKRNHIDLFQSLLNRYLRLFPVVAATTVVSFVLMRMGLMFHLDIAANVRNYDYLLNFCDFQPTIFSLICNIFFKPFWYGSEYVAPFWTICYEFFGYIIVLILCALSKDKKWRRIMYVMVALFLLMIHESNYCAFIFGVFVADLYYYPVVNTTWFAKIYKGWIGSKYFLIPAYFLGTLLACIPIQSEGLYLYLPSFVENGVYRAAGIAICMWCFLNCKIAQRLLEAKPLLWLGKISFTTYSIHWPVMLSLEAGLFMLFSDLKSYDYAALISFGITVPCIMVLSWLMWRYIENNPWIIVARRALVDKVRG